KLLNAGLKSNPRANGSRPVFGDDIAQVFGCEVTAPVGRQSVIGLTRPQSIRVWVGAVEAIEHVLDECDTFFRRQSPRLLAQRLYRWSHFYSLSKRPSKIAARRPRLKPPPPACCIYPPPRSRRSLAQYPRRFLISRSKPRSGGS